MEPVSLLSAGAWALRNWKLLLAGTAIAGLAAWGGWNAYQRAQAEDALANQKLKIAEDNNAAWQERERKRQEFEAEVRSGLAKLTEQVKAATANNETYKRQVNSNADRDVPLTPADLDDLRLLKHGRDNAPGGNPVRPAR